MENQETLPKIKNQAITDNYAIYEGDCMAVLPTVKSKSIDAIIYSPPFCGLYNYSSDAEDFSNCESKDLFLQQYEFLIAETARLIKPGCIVAVHCQDIIENTTSHDIWDFPHEIIALHEKHGFHYKNRITIWKEPLEIRMRTMVRSLMHKTICEDSSRVFTAVPDYVLIFKMGGERDVPVEHPLGLTHYAGRLPLLPDHLNDYGLPLSEFPMQGDFGNWFYGYSNESFKALQKKYEGWKEPQTNKLSHVIFQRYMSSVWDDIRSSNVLPFKNTREEDDEKHVHPLQLDVIDRLVELYTNPGEVVLTPFMGVGSEVFSPVSMGRFGIGIELKDSYFKQAVLNCKEAAKRFLETKPRELFDQLIDVTTMD